MASFDLIELSLDPLDVTPTLEDEFTATVVKKEIDNLDDIDHVKIASKQLVSLVMQRQAIIRALVKRLAVDNENVRIQRFEG
ncbi:MAG: hypothetical protein CBE08_004435 [Euryarchaeota archaeon TMED248]|nr:MAG: hypothetical protein CBE08_004435 [Euryarchaeota archaeon TMED248]|tara:strand:- start:874 stop:1119 length:246 start_codon:yes stop_codon:yes gene_type:complete